MATRLGRTAGRGPMLLLSLAVVAYAGALLVTRAFPSELAPSLRVHGVAISLHIVGAVLALALGPFQFLAQWRGRHPNAHRRTGRLYLLGVLAGGPAASTWRPSRTAARSPGSGSAAWGCCGWRPACWRTGRSGRGGSGRTAAG